MLVNDATMYSGSIKIADRPPARYDKNGCKNVCGNKTVQERAFPPADISEIGLICGFRKKSPVG